MFIYQFNRLIRNRWLWGFFAVVIAFAFVGVPLVAQLDSRSVRGDAVGQLGDQPVSRQDFARTYSFIHGMEEAGQSGNDRDRLTWKRLASLKTAESLGLAAGEAEVGEAIVNDPSFQVDGRFSRDYYRAILNQARMDPQTYEDYTAQSISMMKLADLLSAAVWVSPVEIQSGVADLTDRLNLQYIFFSNLFSEVEVELDETALAQYHEEHGEEFRLPEKVSVRYARLALSNYFDTVDIRPEDVREFYDNHRERYLLPETTNDVQAVTNDVDRLIPFEEVKADILADLQRADSSFAARMDAADFSAGLFRDDRPDALEQRARDAGIPVYTTGWFSAQTIPEGVGAGPEFVEAAFDLDGARRSSRYSDVISGLDYLYVLAAHRRRESEIPPLDEITDKVRDKAAKAARAELFASHANDLREQIARELGSGQSFTAAADDAGYQASTNMTLSAMESLWSDEIPHREILLRAAMPMAPGSLSRVEEVPGGAIIVYLEDRQPGDQSMAQMAREQLRREQERPRFFALAEEWQQWNLERLQK